jgi:predicted TPR repeat methyltransferase
VAAYRGALAIDPRYAKALLNLGNELHRQAGWDEALVVYRQLAEVDPDSAVAQHMTAALSGVTTAGCPAAFVKSLFDRCAADYDERLVSGLGYQAPERLGQLLVDHGPKPLRFARAIDLGCGTGLMGRAIRSLCDHLIGVDLSPQMIAEARRAGGYDALLVADVVTYLDGDDEPSDLIVAADMLNYLGDLADLFRAVARHCAPGARFAFTTEAAATEGYVLTRSGRYRHHQRTIEQLAQGHGFRCSAQRDESFRREREASVAGRLFLLEWTG